MRLDEIRPLVVLEFDGSHACLCGQRVVRDDPEGDGSDELFVVCDDGNAHPLQEMCDANGEMDEGIELAAEQPAFTEVWAPDLPAMEARIMAEVARLASTDDDKRPQIRQYLNEALFNLTMLRFFVDQHELATMDEQLLLAANDLSTAPDDEHMH